MTCPTCGTPISGVTAEGPGEHFLDPCGHRVPTASAREFAGGADQGRGVRADGGRHLTELDCPNCEDVADARYLGTAPTDEHSGHIVGWECTECDAELQEHVDHRGSSFDLRVVGEKSDTGTESEGSA